MNYKKIFLKKGKESSLERFHPWVFSGAVAYADKNIAEGEIVDWQEVQRQWDEYYALHPEDAPQGE